MNRRIMLALAATVALIVPTGGGWAASGAPEPDEPGVPGVHDRPGPLAVAQRAARARALEAKLRGKIPADARVAKVAGDRVGRQGRVNRGQYVELEETGRDRIFVVLAEFGKKIDPETGGVAGPRPNQIPKPNRRKDNFTPWQRNYDREHYLDMYFRQMKDYYRMQSSGRYVIDGDVTEWVKVPYNEAYYGSDLGCGDHDCNVGSLIRDAISRWTSDRLAEGQTKAEVQAYLATFDRKDRYDADGDGDFDEPDGYIDHFQIVHAGADQASGGGAQGDDAIWSHRSYVGIVGLGQWGSEAAPFGGMQFGGTGEFAEEDGPDATGYWVGDYTIQPENGALGVFAHEYAHDLGLPDQYDTSYTGESSSEFWTLMSVGTYGSTGEANVGEGNRPIDMNAWDKFQLGWLDPEVIEHGTKRVTTLGPAEYNTSEPQGAVITLPDKTVTTDLGDPTSGSTLYYSGSGNDLDNTMTRTVTLPSGSVTLEAQANFDIELDWDYAYLTVDGAPVQTSLSSLNDPNSQNFGFGITGTTSGQWVTLTADLSDFAGQTVELGWRYWTDPLVAESGLLLDDIAITGLPIDDAESDEGWVFDGFRTSTGHETSDHFNAYFLESRNYLSYDKSLQTGPYVWGMPDSKPDWATHFPYQDGLLISYWDTSQTDNNTGEHPGEGLILQVDSHPKPLRSPDGAPWRTRVQSFDSTFGKQRTDTLRLMFEEQPSVHWPRKGVRLFNDRKSYWSPITPDASVQVPNSGTRVKVLKAQRDGLTTIKVN